MPREIMENASDREALLLLIGWLRGKGMYRKALEDTGLHYQAEFPEIVDRLDSKRPFNGR